MRSDLEVPVPWRHPPLFPLCCPHAPSSCVWCAIDGCKLLPASRRSHGCKRCRGHVCGVLALFCGWPVHCAVARYREKRGQHGSNTFELRPSRLLRRFALNLIQRRFNASCGITTSTNRQRLESRWGETCMDCVDRKWQFCVVNERGGLEAAFHASYDESPSA